jgi:hypothetical protein
MKTTHQVLLLLLATIYVYAGQAGSNAPPETAPPREVFYPGFKVGLGAPGSSAKLQDLPTTFQSNTQCGPHSKNLIRSKPYTFRTTKGKEVMVCQFDCLSSFYIHKRRKKLFKRCERGRYYSYGVYKSDGCKDPAKADDDTRKTAINICLNINRCSGDLLSASTVMKDPDIFASASGYNSDCDD